MKLVTRKDGQIISSCALGEEVLYLGRSKKNSIVLPETGVSRRHAKVFTQAGHVFLEDLKSVNGTRLSGQTVRRAELKIGDEFEIGPFVIRLESAADNAQASSSQAPEITSNTTFAEASTDVEPDEHTMPPTDSDRFMDAIAVRPKAPTKIPALQQFLENPAEDPAPEPPVAADLPVQHTARLVRLDGEETGQEIPIEKDQTTLGSAQDSDVVVSSNEVAPVHAEIEKTGEGFVLRAKDESTHTFVDGVPVRERPLESHDIVHLGPARFEFLEGTARSRAQVRSRVVQRPMKQVRSIAFLTDWRFLVAAGLLLGALLVALLPRRPIVTSPPAPPQPTVAATSTAAAVDPEKFRVIQHKLDRARKLLAEKKYDETEARLRDILNRDDPNQPEALEMLENLDTTRARDQQVEAARKTAAAQKEAKIREILDEGDRWASQGNFTKARAVYKEALKIDRTNRLATAALAEIQAAEEGQKRQAAAKRKSNEELKRLYSEGIKKFEAGNLPEAQRLLEQVAGRKNHVYQASAQKIIQEIERQAQAALDKNVELAGSLIAQDSLLEARKQLKIVLGQYPRHKKALEMARDVEALLEKKAKQTYTEGITYLEVVEDRAAAAEKFKEVLRYAVTPNNEYKLKAEKKLREIKASEN